MRIDLACAECGRNRFTLNDVESDDGVVHCEDCGHEVGTLGRLKEAVAAAALRNGKEDDAAVF